MHQSRTHRMDGQKVLDCRGNVAQAASGEVVSSAISGTRQWDLAPLSRKMPVRPPRLLVSQQALRGYGATALDHQAGGGGGAPLCSPTAGGAGPTQPAGGSQTARRARSGALPPVDGPPVEAAKRAGDRCRARQRCSRAPADRPGRRQPWRLRHAIRSPGPGPLAPGPRRGLSAVLCPTPAPPSGCQADVSGARDHTARLARLAHARTEPGPPWRLAPVVDALQALRGGPWMAR